MRLLQGLAHGGIVMAANAPPHYSPSDPKLSRPPAPRPAPAESDPCPADRTRPWSPFSGYTLADVPVMSIVSLPVTTDELRDGSDVYTAAYARRMGRHLGQLAWSADNQNASKTIEIIRGRAYPGENGEGTTGPESHGTLAGAVATKKPRFYSIRVRRRGRA